MSKLRQILEKADNNIVDDDVLEQIGGYFEDVTFMLESLGDMEVIPSHIQRKIFKVRKDVMKIQSDIDKEINQ